MYYASIGMLSLVIHVIINFEALRKSHITFGIRIRQRYRAFLYAVMVYYVSDILWGILYDYRIIIPTYIDTVIYFSSMVVSVLLWTRFVVAYLDNNGRFSRILIYSGYTILLYEIIALMINFFMPIVFMFDENKVYVPGQARYITLFIQMFLFLMAAFYTFAKSFKVNGVERSHHITVGISGVLMTIFIALQSLYPLLPFYAVGCLLATCMIHSFVYRDIAIQYSQEIENNKKKAYKDPLTGVKNKLAYIDAVKKIESRMEEKKLDEDGVVVFDLNGLKHVNDTLGHAAGDEYIQNACRMICVRFKHSPVFRIGGDEFAAILEGSDYENRMNLLETFEAEIDQNQREGRVVVSSGLDIYDSKKDSRFNDVFERADRKMYERKQVLKQMESAMA